MFLFNVHHVNKDDYTFGSMSTLSHKWWGKVTVYGSSIAITIVTIGNAIVKITHSGLAIHCTAMLHLTKMGKCKSSTVIHQIQFLQIIQVSITQDGIDDIAQVEEDCWRHTVANH